jgi:competence ComEA-like helix-hairpin-helix protein
MTLSDWKRKNSLMEISENRIKGLVAVCLTLAIIPFISLLFPVFSKNKIPVFADQCNDCLAIKIVENNQSAGVYFVPPGTSVNKLLESAGIGQSSENNLLLKTGMKLIIDSASGNKDIVVTEMPAADRLSVGLPIDINNATENDLLSIKGIGPSTAQKILDLRNKLSRFKDIKQLTEIKGIKEKKLAEIQKYLYIEERQR